MSRGYDLLIRRYVDWLQRYYGWVLLAGLLLTVVGSLSAARFELRTDFAELLPQDEPSIKDLERAKQRMGGLSNLIVTVEGDSPEANRKLVDDIATKLERLPKDTIVYFKYHIKEEKRFYERFKHLFAELVDLEEIHRRLKAKIRYERIKNNPVLNMDFDGQELEPVGFDLSDIEAKYEKRAEESKTSTYYHDYFSGEDDRLFAILIYPPGASTGVDFGRLLHHRIAHAVAEVCQAGPVPLESSMDELQKLTSEGCRARYGPSIEVGYTGSVVNALVEQAAIVDDLVWVTCVCLFFVGLVILLYFRRIRSLPVIGLPLIMGTIWTFGISYYIVGCLNTSTAFLAAIIVGNGINFGLIQLARYMEERRSGLEVDEALSSAIKYTAQATSTAALAASIAYGSLIITEFRGFNGFGYMGGLGMILCWISAFTVQPAMIAAVEKLSPFRIRVTRRKIQSGLFVKPYSRFVTRFGYPLHGIGWIFAAVCVVVTIPYLKDPYEYDFRNLRNQKALLTGSGRLSSRVDGLFPERLNPNFILADRLDQVPLIQEELERNNSTGPNQGLFQKIRSIYSYLPSDQKAKIKVLNKIDRLLSKSTLTWLDDEQRKQVDEYRPPKDLRPVGLEDLPSAVRRQFTELDGRVGLPLALYPRHGRSIYDGRFLMQVSEASRLVQLPCGEEVSSAGVATIFSDMLRAIERDGPRAVLASLIGIMLLVILAYRAWRYVVLILVTLFFGVVWTVGPAALIDLKLNFLNFIALPITFGIGIDYAVNILNRYRIEGRASMGRVISSTGGAVILCSLTTLIGYSSLLIADTQALVSFGILADIGELASLGAAVFMMPVIVQVFERIRIRKQAQSERRAALESK
ncbi:MAG: MMPL family transporter [Deltaproteobacteria bacterium]|nr:MMPL family transporter [Deltaproteobacteria bacterium]